MSEQRSPPSNGGISRLFAGVPRSDLGLDAVLHHWWHAHARLAKDLPGLVRYVQYHLVLDDAGEPRRGLRGFGVFSLLEFSDRARLDRAFGLTGQVHPALAAANSDETAFLDTDAASGGIVGRRRILRGGSCRPPFVALVPGGVDDPGEAVRWERVVAEPPPLPWDTVTWDRFDLLGYETATLALEDHRDLALVTPRVVVGVG